jgi:hypothetical protein
LAGTTENRYISNLRQFQLTQNALDRDSIGASGAARDSERWRVATFLALPRMLLIVFSCYVTVTR